MARALIQAGTEAVFPAQYLEGGVAGDLTGWTVSVTANNARGTWTAGVEMTDAANGEFTFTFQEADTLAMADRGAVEVRMARTQGDVTLPLGVFKAGVI